MAGEQTQKPKTKRKKTLIGCGVLLVIFILIVVGIGTCLGGESDTPGVTEQPTPTPPAYILQLISASHERAYDYVTMSGEVKNISSKNLENVMVVVNYYTDDDTFVKTDEALISYNPILPGQISPFKSITTDNPAIKRYKITFKYFWGGKIPTEDKRK
ncbi:FxLYD domain-containing protein [Chloroflexota bacterium]